MQQQHLVSDSSVKQLLKQYNLHENDSKENSNNLQNTLDNSIRQFIEKSMRGGGGTVSLPSDYFSGVMGSAYSAVSTAHTAVAEAGSDLVRPELLAYSVVGGASKPSKLVNISCLVATTGMTRKQAKGIEALLNEHIYAFMHDVSKMVKNKGRVIGKTHLHKMK
jgi:hypothetical protein